MPSLFRLLLTVALLAGLAYGAMLALVTFVTPEPHEIIQNVPAARLNK
ncbi:MAG TPA: histidine kinase [Methylovirgula sp.]|nr:histidine kinase [Methylovirgula sp.]